jgi:hypothetical protein
LTILSLTVVVVGYLILSALSEAYRTFGKRPEATRNLMIISDDVLDPMESDLDDDILYVAQDLFPDAVTKVSPCIFRHMNIEDRVLQVRAVPPEDFTDLYQLSLIEGSWPADKSQIIATDGAVYIYQWTLGSKITIYGSEFELVGIVKALGSKYASLWMTYAAGEQLFGTKRGYQIGYVMVNPRADIETVRAGLETDPRLAGRYAVYFEDQLSERYNQATQDVLQLTIILMFVALTAISFGTYHTTGLTLVERSWEIAILRVVGFSKGAIRGFFFTRTLFQILIAYGVGWGVATLFIRWQQATSPIILHSAPLTLSLTTPGIFIGLVLTVLFALLGVWLPTGRQFHTTVAEQISR